MNIDEIRAEWRIHQEFPATMGVGVAPSQFEVRTFDKFIKTVYRNSWGDVYASVHNTIERANNRYDRIFFDMDNNNLQKAMDDTKLLCNVLYEKGIPFRSYFSGAKGFHVYIDFPLTRIPDYGDRMETFIGIVKATFPEIDSFDMRVCKDSRRIARVPYTVNSKTGKLCLPIDILNSTLDDMKAVPIRIERSAKFIKSYMDMEIPESEEASSPKEENVSHQLSYIMNNKDKILDGRKNLIWKVIIPSMVQLNYSDRHVFESVKSFCLGSGEVWDSRMRNFTKYYLKRTRKHGWSPMRLDRFRTEYGLKGI